MASRFELARQSVGWLLFALCLVAVLRTVSGLLHEIGHALHLVLFTGIVPQICFRGSAWMPLGWQVYGAPRVEAPSDAAVLTVLGGSMLPLLVALVLSRLPFRPEANRGTLRIAVSYLALFQAALWTANAAALWTDDPDATSDAYWLLVLTGLAKPLRRGEDTDSSVLYEGWAPLILFLMLAPAFIVLLRVFWSALFSSAQAWTDAAGRVHAAVLVSVVALLALSPTYKAGWDVPLLLGTSSAVSVLSILALRWSRPLPASGPSRAIFGTGAAAAYLVTTIILTVAFTEPRRGEYSQSWKCTPALRAQTGVPIEPGV